MPRVYLTMGERRRGEAITALFTRDEKQRIFAAARANNLTASVFIHQIVLAQIGTAA